MSGNCCNDTELPIGPVGPQGPIGPTGAQGAQGEPGQDGADGVDGADGLPGDPTAMAAFGAVPNANGATIAGNLLTLQPCSDLFPGGITIGTQNIAGQKTFKIVPGDMILSSDGVGIGALPNSRLFINTKKTFTTSLSSSQSDIHHSLNTDFNYTSVNALISSCAGLTINTNHIGTFTPSSMFGLVVTNATRTTTNLLKSVGIRAGTAFGNNVAGNSTTNIEFLNVTFTSHTIAGVANTVDTQYNYYSSIPYSNSSLAVFGDFQIDKIYGFYCDDFKEVSKVPIANNDGAAKTSAQIISQAWQFYAKGTNNVNIASYFGNKIGIGLSVLPVSTASIKALLHVGASTTALSQIHLDVGTAPTTPGDGDMWLESNTNTGLKIRIAGVTKTVTLS